MSLHENRVGGSELLPVSETTLDQSDFKQRVKVINGIHVVGEVRHIHELPSEVSVVQITTQSATTARFLHQLHELRPTVSEVGIAPSFYNRLVGIGMRGAARDLGIQLKESVVHPGVSYKKTRWENDESKKALYDAMLKDESKRKIFEMMVEMGFAQAIVGKIYFEEGKSITQIAREMDIPRVKAQRFSSVFLFWLGRLSTDHNVIDGYKLMLRHIKNIFVVV